MQLYFCKCKKSVEFSHFLCCTNTEHRVCLKEKYVFQGCHVYQYMAIIAWKCLLSISWSET